MGAVGAIGAWAADTQELAGREGRALFENRIDNEINSGIGGRTEQGAFAHVMQGEDKGCDEVSFTGSRRPNDVGQILPEGGFIGGVLFRI